MKSLKNVLAALAFVVASAAAFATMGNSNNAMDPITAYKPDTSEICNIEVQCDVSEVGPSCDNYSTIQGVCEPNPAPGLFEQP